MKKIATLLLLCVSLSTAAQTQFMGSIIDWEFMSKDWFDQEGNLKPEKSPEFFDVAIGGVDIVSDSDTTSFLLFVKRNAKVSDSKKVIDECFKVFGNSYFDDSENKGEMSIKWVGENHKVHLFYDKNLDLNLWLEPASTKRIVKTIRKF